MVQMISSAVDNYWRQVDMYLYVRVMFIWSTEASGGMAFFLKLFSFE